MEIIGTGLAYGDRGVEQVPLLFKDTQAAEQALNAAGFRILAHVLALWESFHPYADSTFVTDVQQAVCGLHEHSTPGPSRDKAYFLFHQRWWEMFVGCVLLDQGILLVPRNSWDRAWGGAGPDLQANVDGRRVWIECIAPGAGSGPDRVPELSDEPVDDEPMGDEVVDEEPADDVPVDQIKLRFLNAVDEKRKQLKGHAAASIATPSDGYYRGHGCFDS